jgi:hypothetical protein
MPGSPPTSWTSTPGSSPTKLDPDEFEPIERCRRTSEVFRQLGAGGPGGAVRALVAEPGTVAAALTDHPETRACPTTSARRR